MNVHKIAFVVASHWRFLGAPYERGFCTSYNNGSICNMKEEEKG